LNIMAGGTRSLAQRDLSPGPGGAPRAEDETAARAAVDAAAEAAHAAAPHLRHATDGQLDEAISAMAAQLGQRSADIIGANAADVQAARADGLPTAFVDRLLLDESRVQAMAGQLLALAGIPAEPGAQVLRALPGGLELQEWRRPVGVIGANFEARPNVALDVASQLIKSRNAGVLRTGSSALRSAAVLVDTVIGPAMRGAGLDPAAIQLIRVPGRAAAYALVRQPRLIPLVILRGSGASTRELAREAALQGVRALAHADGGAVMYIDQSADQDLASQLIEASLDRLGVCNRLNLLLVQDPVWDTVLPRITETVQRLGVALSLPPHPHELGHEWALDTGREATVTVARVADAASAAELANAETSGLAAAVVAEDADTARVFLHAYAGTGGFWNATTRLLDGFRLLSLPETGINIDAVPGPRGPVTFRDLCLRQYVVMPAGQPAG
jgi:glutamate-5-semialdehyde dehydrogenase